MGLSDEGKLSEHIVVRPLKLSDVPKMSLWGVHEDQRYQSYNFPYRQFIDYLLWYKSKKSFLKKYIFGVFLENELLGYITLKQINWLKREAYMGVAFDPDQIDKGYGTIGIQVYLELVMRQYKLKRIFLKTGGFNLRGQRCYNKVGFKEFKRVFEPYEDQSQQFELLLRYEDFKMVENEIWTDYIYMVYEKKDAPSE